MGGLAKSSQPVGKNVNGALSYVINNNRTNHGFQDKYQRKNDVFYPLLFDSVQRRLKMSLGKNVNVALKIRKGGFKK